MLNASLAECMAAEVHWVRSRPAVYEVKMGTILVWSLRQAAFDTLLGAPRAVGLDCILAQSLAEADPYLARAGVDLIVIDTHPKLLALLCQLPALLPRVCAVPLLVVCTSDEAPSKLRESGYLDVNAIVWPVDRQTYVMRIKNLVRGGIGVTSPSPQICDDEDGLVCNSPAMKTLRLELAAVATIPYPVLIQAPTGTDTAAVARAIHSLGLRLPEPLLVVECAIVTAQEIEDILNVTLSIGAGNKSRTRKQTFGAILLRDVEKMPIHLQLRWGGVLDSLPRKALQPDGEPGLPRIMASSGQDLWSLMEAGKFNSRLYYALTPCSIMVPPLRRRPEDIPELIRRKVRAHCSILGKVRAVSPEALAAFAKHDWKGEEAELEAIAAKAVRISQDVVITEADAHSVLNGKMGKPDPVCEPGHESLPHFVLPREIAEVKPLSRVLRECERDYIAACIKLYDGDKEKVAEALGVSLATLYRKLPDA